MRDPDLNLGVILRAGPFVNSAKESRMDSELTLQSFEWTQGPPWGRVWSGPWKPKPKNAAFLDEFTAGTKKNLVSSMNSLGTKKSHKTARSKCLPWGRLESEPSQPNATKTLQFSTNPMEKPKKTVIFSTNLLEIQKNVKKDTFSNGSPHQKTCLWLQ